MAIQLSEQNEQLLLTKNIVNGYRMANQLVAVQEKFNRFILHEGEFSAEVSKYLEKLSENRKFEIEISDEFSFEFTRLLPVSSNAGSVIFFNENIHKNFLKNNHSSVAKFIDLSSRESDHSSVINEFIKMGFSLVNIPYLLRFIDDTIDLINSKFFGIHSIPFFNDNKSNFFSNVSLISQNAQNIISVLRAKLLGFEQYVSQYIAQHYGIGDSINFAVKVIDQIRYYLRNLHESFASLLASESCAPDPIEITNYYPWSDPEYFEARKGAKDDWRDFGEDGNVPIFGMSRLQISAIPRATKTKTPFKFDGTGFEPPQVPESHWLKQDQVSQFEQTVTSASLAALAQLSLATNNMNENSGHTQAEEQAPSPSQT